VSSASQVPRTPVEIAAGPVQLLPLSLADAPDLLAPLMDSEVVRWTAGGSPGTPEETQAWVERRLAEIAAGTTVSWAIRTAVGGLFAGHINLFNLDDEHAVAEVGYFIAPDHRRQGYARTALGAVTRYGFAALDLHRITLIHAVGNTASCALARACGYTLEGTTRGSYVLHGERVDEHLHARLASDAPVNA
jgi:RimJ/RimL family protein N-acetyltransferase